MLNSKYVIFLNGNEIKTTRGVEYTAMIWSKVKDLADTLNVSAWLVDGNTGEILEEMEPDE